MKDAIIKYKFELTKVLDLQAQADVLRYNAQSELMAALDTWATKEGIGKTELAKKLGVSRMFLYDMKKQNRHIPYRILENLSKSTKEGIK